MIEPPVYLPEPETSRGRPASFDINEYVQLLLRRWPLIATMVILGVAIGVTRFYLTPPQYRAQTTLQIEQRSLFALGGNSNPWLEAWAGMKYYPTQYRLLESRGLAERVVVDLGLIDRQLFNPSAAAPGARPADADEASRAEEQLLARQAARIQSGLSVRPISGTELVQLSFESGDPVLAATIVNGIADAYIDWGIERRTENVGKASSFIDQQIEAFKGEIDDKERQLRQYGRDVDIVNLDPESNEVLERIAQLNRSYTQAIADRVEAEARYYELQASPPATIADASPTPTIEDARRALLGLERDYEAKLTVYKPDHPVMRDLQARIEEQGAHLSVVINDEVQSMRRQANALLQTARRRERALKAQFDSARTDAMALNSASVEFKNLEMEIETRRELLDQLLRKQSEAGMTARLQTTRESNVRVVDRALVPGSPFRPSLRTNVTTGLAAGLALGVGLVLLFHFLDRSIKSAEELERVLGLPVLAVIPELAERGRSTRLYYGYGRRRRRRPAAGKDQERPRQIELLPEAHPRLGASEAYRSLRTAMLLSTAGGLAVVSITSAEAGEGKTATAANLAVVLAQLGRKVLLIDADLRKARLHQIFKVSNRKGLVNVLTEALELQSAVQSTPTAHLTLLSSGPHPPNPSELLASEAMTNLIRQAKSLYDFVIIDSPPVLAVTDATLVGKLSDGVLLCLRAGSVQRRDARSCSDQLRLADVRIIGALLNRYQPTRATGYDRRYYYHYYDYEAYVGDGDSTADTAA